MKRFLPPFSLAVLIGIAVGAAEPAQAASSFSFSYSEGGYHAPRYTSSYSHHRGRHHSHFKNHHPVFYPHYRAPMVVYAPPPVVYRTTVVSPVRYVDGGSLLAEQASPSYINTYGQQCREYQSKDWIGGRLQNTYGTACLQPDGAWRVVD